MDQSSHTQIPPLHISTGYDPGDARPLFFPVICVDKSIKPLELEISPVILGFLHCPALWPGSGVASPGGGSCVRCYAFALLRFQVREWSLFLTIIPCGTHGHSVP